MKLKVDFNKENEKPDTREENKAIKTNDEKDDIEKKIKAAEKANRELLRQNIFKDLNYFLRRITAAGNIFFEGEAYEMPCMAGLEIHGFGQLSLPLKGNEGDELFRICQEINGNNERDFSSLKASQFTITNPEWQDRLNELLERVAKGLGCQAEIEVQYKILIFREKMNKLLKNIFLKRHF